MTDQLPFIAPPWWTSKTTWAGVATAMLTLLQNLGIQVDPFWTDHLATYLLDTAQLIGFIAFIGLHLRSRYLAHKTFVTQVNLTGATK